MVRSPSVVEGGGSWREGQARAQPQLALHLQRFGREAVSGVGGFPSVAFAGANLGDEESVECEQSLLIPSSLCAGSCALPS